MFSSCAYFYNSFLNNDSYLDRAANKSDFWILFSESFVVEIGSSESSKDREILEGHSDL